MRGPQGGRRRALLYRAVRSEHDDAAGAHVALHDAYAAPVRHDRFAGRDPSCPRVQPHEECAARQVGVLDDE